MENNVFLKAETLDSTMEENCMIQIVGELESDTETILKTSEKGTIIYKHAACQAASALTSDVLVPIMFCTLFSPICEASVQVNLPICSVSDSSEPPAVTSSKDRESKDHITSFKKRKKCIVAQTYRKERYDINSAPHGCQGPEDDVFLSPSPAGDNVEDYILSEDSEYSSEDDLAFWQKMKRHEKGKNKESSRNEQFRKYSPHGGNFESEKITYCSRNSCVKVQKCNDELLLLSKEGSKILDKVSSVVQGSEKKDDWITDDEVDDEDHENIEQAFKKEWKEKRLPYNSKEKNFPCEICGKRYSKHSYLRAHIVREHKEHEEAKRYPYSCQHCKKVYVSEKQLLQHQHKHKGPCEICGIVMKCNGLLWAHQRNHDSACKVCNRKFQTKESAYMHMRLKHSENPVPCAECDRMFPFEFIRKRHAKTHHNVEVTRYSCDKCDFWSVGQRALKIHQRRTHGSKLDLFTCKECKCIFNSKVTYKNHVATHVSNSSIVCLSCSAKFISEDELHAHRISVHGVTDKVDTRKETISNYCNSSHVSHYLCALCNITLSDTEDLSQHMYKYHNIDVDSPRVIKPEIEPFLIPEVDENNESTLQTVDIEGTNPQELDRVIKTEPTPVISTDISCSSGRSALLVPASVVPPNVNIVEVNGVQYHVIRESQWQ